MKKIWTLVLVALFVSAPLGMCFAQMYWTPGEESEPTVEQDKSKLKFGRDVLAPSLKDKEIYDYQESGFIVDEPEAPATRPTPTLTPGARRQQGTIQEPLPRRIVPAPPRRNRAVTTTPRGPRSQPAGPAATPAEKKQAPTPVTTSPTDQADKKKMQWGKVEVKPVEPKQEKKKLQWGKTENAP